MKLSLKPLKWLELARELLQAVKRPPLRIPHGPTPAELDGPPAVVGPPAADAPSIVCRWCRRPVLEHIGAGLWCPTASPMGQRTTYEPSL